MDPQTEVSNLPGIGYYYSRKLNRLGISTLQDLIYHFPFRYDDFSKIENIHNITPDEKLSIVGLIWEIKNIRTRSGKFITAATIADSSGTLEVIWFNQPYLTKTLKTGMQVSLSGKIQKKGYRLQLISPSYEILRNQQPDLDQIPATTLHTGRLVPIYPETEGISSKWLRAKIAKLLPLYLKELNDFLPREIIKRQKFQSLNYALDKIHFPKDLEEVRLARTRLAFDELFLIQLLSQLRKKDWRDNKNAVIMKIDRQKIYKLVKSLPFTLTNAQKRAYEEIFTDMQKDIPANRLLEGDVGSGKTVVAAIAAFVCFGNGHDVLIAAPTEILAFQHQKTLDGILSPYGISVGIWTSSKKIKGNVVCGTHALLSSFKPERNIGLVIVDEQHRFGVAQRAQLFLNQSKQKTPHLLTMTATPIPRTLALTLYGDLDLSFLDEMPKGRRKVSTFVVPNFKRNDAYKFIEKQIGFGRQAFIITPFVEPSETMATVKAASKEFEYLKTKFSKTTKLGLLHGRLKSKEKERVIDAFRNNKIKILVATPVVEVGIDVSNATVMMIESAERFGLAQLHQLRGRVGRGKHKSYCLLFSEARGENSFKRLKSMEKIHIGAELAEIDLKMRGPGDIYGFKQSGFTNLKLADLSDHQAIAIAQQEAKKLIDKDPNFKSYPHLTDKIREFQLELAQPN